MKLHFFLTALLCCACTPANDDPAREIAEPQPEPARAPQPQPEQPLHAADDPSLPPSQTTPGPVPLAYRHVWAIDPADCTRMPGPTRIAIAPGAVRFYEGRSVVKTAQESGAELRMEVDHIAEGETSPEVHTLSLSPEGQLTYQRRGETFRYTRCE